MPKTWIAAHPLKVNDVAKAKKWCEGWAAITFQPTYVRLIVCNAIKWQEIAADNSSFDLRHNKEHPYMVLCQVLEGLYRMFEFEQLEDAVRFALATRTRLQEFQASQQRGLPESVQVFAFILAGEWNPQNQPGEDNPLGMRALRWHVARGCYSSMYGVWPPGLGPNKRSKRKANSNSKRHKKS